MNGPPKRLIGKEVIVLMGEDRNGQRQQFLPIIRSDNGRFFNLGDSNMPIMDNIEGRFAQILPPKIPDKQGKLLAQAMMKMKQAKMVKLGNPTRHIR